MQPTAMLSTYKYRQETKLTQMQSTDMLSTYKYRQETKLTWMQSTDMHSTFTGTLDFPFCTFNKSSKWEK